MRVSRGTRCLDGKRVLLAEDDYHIADSTARALRLLGAEVVGPFRRLSDALPSARAERLDAAVLDVNLEGSLVFPVADVLASRGIPFVFATGYSAGAIPACYADVPRWEKPFAVGAMACSLADIEPVAPPAGAGG